jgi:putative phosphoesterase
MEEEMKLGIISDTHDNVWRLEEAFQYLKGVEEILHCGDLISPFMVHRLGKGLAGIPVHLVWGNNDGDRRAVSAATALYPEIQIYGEFAEIELEGLRIAIIHYPEIARGLAKGESYDLVCYGHDHTAHQETIGNTLLLNPGEVMGLKGTASLVIYDTKTKIAEKKVIWEETD